MANRSHCQSPVRRSLLPLAPLVALLASSLPAPVAAGGEERVDAAGINAPGAVESGLPLYLEKWDAVKAGGHAEYETRSARVEAQST